MAHPTADDVSAIDLFQALSPEQAAVVAEWLDEEEFSAGRALTHQDASGYAFYVLRIGRAQVMVDGQPVRELGPGDFFGELSLVGEGRRTATVRMVEDGVVWVMFGTRFRELQDAHPAIAETIEDTARSRAATAMPGTSG